MNRHDVWEASRREEPQVDPRLSGGILNVDLGALVDNWHVLAKASAGAECAAVVKADAYGLGLREVAPALWRAGCRSFFVALPEEGASLRRLCPRAVIHVLDGLLPEASDFCREHGLRPVLNSLEEVEEWAAHAAAHDVILPAALHVDTGMNRLGLTMEEARRLAARRGWREHVRLTLVMSHLACADEPGHEMNARQKALFDEVRGLFPGVPSSLANSAATLAWPEWEHELRRPGIALYGGNPFSGRANPMKPVVSLYGTVLRVREIESGASVGYGATWKARRPSRIAVLGVGYADGLHRALSTPAAGPAQVMIAGAYAPYAGRVSMDCICVDITDIDPARVERGMRAEILGPHITVDDMAGWAGTISYEVLTSLGGRFTRLYSPAG